MIGRKECTGCALPVYYCQTSDAIFYAGPSVELAFELVLMERMAGDWIRGKTLRDVIESFLPVERGSWLPSPHDVRVSIETYVSLVCELPRENRLCIHCGEHPYAMVFDGNVKCRIKMLPPVALKASDIPEDDEMFKFKFGDGKTNVSMLQEQLCFPIVRNFILGENRAKFVKPQAIIKSMSPFVIRESGFQDGATQNTEFEKVRSRYSRSTDGEISPEALQAAEDCLVSFGEARKEDLRKVAKDLEITWYSSMDYSQLRQAVVDQFKNAHGRSHFVKLLTTVTASSGGLMVGCCCHGVIYCYKVLTRGESGRDVFDLLRSLRYFPSVVYYDYPESVRPHFVRSVSSNPLVNGDGAPPMPRDSDGAAPLVRLPFLDHQHRIINVADQFRSEATEKGLELHPKTGYPYVHLVREAFHDSNAAEGSDGRRYSRKRYADLRATDTHDIISPRLEAIFGVNKRVLQSLHFKGYSASNLQFYAAVQYHMNHRVNMKSNHENGRVNRGNTVDPLNPQ